MSRYNKNMVEKNKTLIICAEIGHNWGRDMNMAKDLIWKAKDCGADIAKFQLYDIDKIKQPHESHYQELKDSQLTKEQITELAAECKVADIEFLASAFDIERLGWLEEIGVKRHKLASRSINDRELITAMEKTGKPIIASLGNWKGEGLPKIKNAQFLYCLTRHQIEDNGVQDFPEKFDKLAGFSDHTIGMDYAKLAIDRGAQIIEKHFTFNRNLAGCDQAASMTPKQLEDLINYEK